MSETFYRDHIEGLTEQDKDRIDTFAACLGMGPKYKPIPNPKRECPNCKKITAYVKEIHPDTDMNEMVLYCPECKFQGEL